MTDADSLLRRLDELGDTFHAAAKRIRRHYFWKGVVVGMVFMYLEMLVRGWLA